MKKIAIWVILASAFTPLIISPNLVTFAIGGKTFFIRSIAFLSFAVITIFLFLKKNIEFKNEIFKKIKIIFTKKLFIALLINFIFLGLSTFLAYDQNIAFFGEPFRTEGFLTLFSFFTLFFLMVLLFEKKDWNRYVFLTSISTIILFIIELRQAFLGMIRPDSLTGNPTFLSGYLIFSFFSGLYIFWQEKYNKKYLIKYFGIMIAIISLIGILMTKTRATLLALIVAFVVSLIVIILKGNNIFLLGKTLRFLSITTLTLLLILMGIFFITKKSIFWQNIPGFNRLATTSLNEGTAASRIKFAKSSINGFFKDSSIPVLIFGWGPENYIYFFQEHYDPTIYRFEQALTDRAHNKLIDVLVMFGIIGLISYLIVWYFLFKLSLEIVDNNIFLGLLIVFFLTAYFVNNLFVFDVAITYLAFHSIAALILFYSNERK